MNLQNLVLKSLLRGVDVLFNLCSKFERRGFVMRTLLGQKQNRIERKLEEVRIATEIWMTKLAWRFKYLNYLESSKWKVLRNRVIIRCKGMCEKCGQARVENVHHLTYENLYNEPLEDLLGVCKECHNNIHGVEDDFLIPLVFGGGEY